MGHMAKITSPVIKKSIWDSLKWRTKQTIEVVENAADQDLLLEPRVMFDAAFAADVLDHAYDADDTAIDTLDHVAVETPESITTQEIVFIDANVDGYAQLAANLSNVVEVVVLNDLSSGVEQITSHMRERQNVDAIHIISHGNDGELFLGNANVTTETILNNQADEWKQIGTHLSQDADILIYGCSFGSGETGLIAMDALAKATDADVAGATQSVTQDQSDLDAAVGDVQTNEVALHGMTDVLAQLADDGMIEIYGTGNASLTNDAGALVGAEVAGIDQVSNAIARIWTYNETTDPGEVQFKIDTSQITGTKGTSLLDYAIVLLDDDGKAIGRLTASGLDSNGIAIFNKVDLADGQRFTIATLRGGDVYFNVQSVTVDEDTPIDLKSLLRSEVLDRGGLANTFDTATAYTWAGSSTPVSFEIPAGTTNIKLSVGGARAAGSQWSDDLLSMQISIDLEAETSQGLVSFIARSGLTNQTGFSGNDIYSWSDKDLSKSQNVKQVSGGEFLTYGGKVRKKGNSGGVISEYDNTQHTLPKIWIEDGVLYVDETSPMNTSFLAEFQTNTASSSDLIASKSAMFTSSQSSKSVTIPDDVAYIRIIQNDLMTYDYRQEHKTVGAHFLDLQSLEGSGMVSGEWTGTSNRDISFSYSLNASTNSDGDLTFNIGASDTTKTGDTTSISQLQNDLKFEVVDGELIISKANGQTGTNSMFTIEFYDRKDGGATAGVLGSSSDRIGWPSFESKTDLEFDIPRGAKFGILNLSAIAKDRWASTGQYNENSAAAYAVVDLENGTSSGNMYMVRAGNPDLMTWQDVPLNQVMAQLMQPNEDEPGSLSLRKSGGAWSFTDKYCGMLNFQSRDPGQTKNLSFQPRMIVT